MSLVKIAPGSSHLPLVTIVTPTFNQADYLAETIDSVLLQDYPNIEYIVIDDGSTDHTQEILKRYDGRIRWESQNNMGQSAALNKGWSMGSGQFVGYLSSDDLLYPGAVSEAARRLQENPEIVLVYPDFRLIDAGGRRIRDVRTPEYSYFDLAVNLICQPGPGALFRREHFQLIGGWNEELKQIPDFEYWLRLSKYGDFLRIPHVLAGSRVHEASQSFTVLSVDRAMEPVMVIKNWCAIGFDHPLARFKRQALGRSHVLSARLLIRSNQWWLGVKQLTEGLGVAPSMLFSRLFWAMLANAALNRLLHRAWAWLRI